MRRVFGFVILVTLVACGTTSTSKIGSGSNVEGALDASAIEGDVSAPSSNDAGSDATVIETADAADAAPFETGRRFYVAPKGTVAAGGDGSLARPWNGILEASKALKTDTVPGDRIVMMSTKGAFGLNDQADFPYPNGTARIQSGFVFGPTFGEHQFASSSASGRIFDFRGDGGQAVVDMRGGTTNAQRMSAALTIRGENVVVRNAKVIAPNFDYLTVVPGPFANAEDASYENIGLSVIGNGNIVEGGDFWGADGFSRFALSITISSESSFRGAEKGSPNTTARVTGVTAHGAFMNIDVGVGGAGSSAAVVVSGTKLEIANNEMVDPVWGRRPQDPAGPGNAAKHGGGFSISGKWFLGADIHHNVVRGGCQDAMQFIGVGIIARQNLIEDVTSIDPVAWEWTGSAWERKTSVGQQGNGLKLGLSGYDGISPTTWKGNDGIAGGFYGVDELANYAVGNRIRRISGIGVSTNGSNGMFIHANEITDARLACIDLHIDTSNTTPRPADRPIVGNQWVSNNYCRLSADAVQFAHGLLVGAGVRAFLFDNVLWGFNDGRTPSLNHRDVGWATTVAPVKDKNLLVTGTSDAFQPYPSQGDLPPGVPAYTEGVGLAAASPLRTAGVALPANAAPPMLLLDIDGKPFGNPPSVGPYQ